eukprot:TRINITY_DN113650_c0_g1_i1.p1 TRINITY_DN113650_c0_g1~~TRINITY_DN113650_c0_g1_i1.p1  ORF type:complete len:374 (+),score=104.91 TRINITY_DN113650_c0_g1_i1:67-1188(+)
MDADAKADLNADEGTAAPDPDIGDERPIEAENDVGDDAGDGDGKPKETMTEFYTRWDKFDAGAEDAKEPVKHRSAEEIFGPPPSKRGYAFRVGGKTQFPEVQELQGETQEAAALRVAQEKRKAGNDFFKEGTIWGAQQASDSWGQGLLALERAKNLRKYRKARLDGGTASEEDWAVQKMEEEDDKAELAWQFEASQTDSADAEPPARRVPAEREVRSLRLTLCCNTAQALLKLKQYEKAIDNADGALDIDPKNVKALWRKAQAVWGTRNPGLARATLGELLQIDETNAAALAMLKEIEVEEERKKARRRGEEAPKRVARSSAAPAAASQKACAENDEVAEDQSLARAEAILQAMQAPFFCCRRRVPAGKAKSA